MLKFSGRIMKLSIAAAMIYGLIAPINADAKGDRGGLEALIEKLAPEQQTQARTLMEEIRAKNAPIREAIKAKKGEIEALMKTPDPDKTQLETLSKQIGELRGQELVNRMEMKEKFQKAGLPDLRKDGKNKEGKDWGARSKPDRDTKKQGKKERSHPGFEQLTPEQQASARQIFEEGRTATQPIREQLKAKNAELEEALKSGNASQAQALSTEIGELKGKMLGARVEMRQNLEKAGLPGDLFARPDKADGKGPRKGPKK